MTTKVPLAVKEATEMRRIIATVNHIAQDRLDIGYAVKECSKIIQNVLCSIPDKKNLKGSVPTPTPIRQDVCELVGRPLVG